MFFRDFNILIYKLNTTPKLCVATPHVLSYDFARFLEIEEQNDLLNT